MRSRWRASKAGLKEPLLASLESMSLGLGVWGLGVFGFRGLGVWGLGVWGFRGLGFGV